MIDAQLERRRAAAADAWDLANEVVLVLAGDPIHIPGRYDLTYPFRAHSEYFWLTDRERAGGVLAYASDDGWVEFVAPVTAVELLWSGTEGMEEGVPEGTRPVDELEAWVRGRPTRHLGATSSPDADLREALTQVRRPKDDVELARMRTATDATRAGFAALRGLITPGRTERELQVELEAAFFRNGADALAFDTIVGAGSHAGVLHFAPTQRTLADGEVVLVDAGGEYRGYASDVTRTYPVNGAFSAEQRSVYDVVRRALDAAIAACGPSVEWRDVHRIAALAIGDGLVDLGILRGDPESLFEQGAVTKFFPHGVGHMIGLGVRDAGGTVAGREPPGAGFPPIRVDLPLQERYAMTVEPGVYFIPRLLDGLDVPQRFLDVGGVRLEQNILVTAGGCEVLTDAIPLA